MSEVYGGKGGFKGVQSELSGKDFDMKKDFKPKHAKPNSQLAKLMMNPTALLNPMSLIKAAVKSKIKVLEL